MGRVEKSQSITRIARQTKRKNRVSIFLDDEFAFGLSEETCIKFSLRTGRELSPTDIEDICRWDEEYQARMTGMRYIDRRRRTREEVVRKLREKEYPEIAIAKAVQFLEEYGLIDEDAYARAWIHDRLLKKSIGRRKLQSDLRAKGINKEKVEAAISDMVDDDLELENAMKAARSRERRLRGEDRKAHERSVVSFLQGRGFGWAEIKQVVAHLRQEWKDGEDA